MVDHYWPWETTINNFANDIISSPTAKILNFCSDEGHVIFFISYLFLHVRIINSHLPAKNIRHLSKLWRTRRDIVVHIQKSPVLVQFVRYEASCTRFIPILLGFGEWIYVYDYVTSGPSHQTAWKICLQKAVQHYNDSSWHNNLKHWMLTTNCMV